MKWLTRQADRYAEWVVSRERRLVTEGAQASKSMWVWGLVRFLIGITALGVGTWDWLAPDDSNLELLGVAMLGGIVGNWAMSSARTQGAYRNGWISGRANMVRNIRQAESMMDWLQGCAVYDSVHVMGFDVEVPGSLEGLEEDE